MDETRKGKQVYHKRTICETLRNLYDVLVIELAETRPEVIHKIVPLLEEAFIMGVKLNKALVEHKLSQDFTADPFNQEKSRAMRKERIRLVELLDANNQILEKFSKEPNP
uniref:Uncharacterized protein n=1 Tax=viral metagenome TaxID=1070528 RepID=A0A6M3K3G1_9ZZZZ